MIGNYDGHYDWAKTFSYNPDFLIVNGGRTVGKTFGLRLWLLNEWIRDGVQAVEVFRTNVIKKKASSNYFGRLVKEYPEFLDKYFFRSDSTGAYVAEKKRGKKKNWMRVFYFLSITEAQTGKMATFDNVRTVFMDEFILDKRNSYARYMPAEFAQLANIVTSVTRQKPGDGTRPRLVLIANPINLINPYYSALGITKPPKFGYTWIDKKKKILIHRLEETEEDKKDKREQTLGGMLVELADDDTERNITFGGDYTIDGESFIKPKTPLGLPLVGMVWKDGQELTLWQAKNSRGYHVRRGLAPQLAPRGQVYYFSRGQAKIDWKVGRRAEERLKWAGEAFAESRVTFETPEDFDTFADIMSYIGIKT